MKMLRGIKRKYTKKTYKIKKEQTLVQLAAPVVIRCVRKRLQALQNETFA